MEIFDNKVIVITGGTGSLGKVLTRRLLEKNLDCRRRLLSSLVMKQNSMRCGWNISRKAM